MHMGQNDFQGGGRGQGEKEMICEAYMHSSIIDCTKMGGTVQQFG